MFLTSLRLERKVHEMAVVERALSFLQPFRVAVF